MCQRGSYGLGWRWRARACTRARLGGGVWGGVHGGAVWKLREAVSPPVTAAPAVPAPAPAVPAAVVSEASEAASSALL